MLSPLSQLNDIILRRYAIEECVESAFCLARDSFHCINRRQGFTPHLHFSLHELITYITHCKCYSLNSPHSLAGTELVTTT